MRRIPREDKIFFLGLALGLILIVLTRLPQFFGGRMSADADECVLGLMAKHMKEGHDFPVFFYGQKYGLSFFEAGLAAIFFKFFVVSTAVLKAAMLVLWSAGAFFLVLSVKEFAGRRAGLIAMALLTFCPGWMAWSLKARGGYITAFVAAHLVIWLIARLNHGGAAKQETSRSANLFCATIGFCAALVFFAQPVWITILPSFILLLVHRRQRGADLAFMAAGTAICSLLVLVSSQYGTPAVWNPPLLQNPGGFVAIRLLPARLWAHFSGAYYLKEAFPPTPLNFTATLCWYAALLIAVYAVVWSVIRRERFGPAQATALALLGPPFFSVLINRDFYMVRYLLPVAPVLVMLLAIQLAPLLRQKRTGWIWALGGVALLLFSGTGAAIESGMVSYDGTTSRSGPPKDKTVGELAEELLSHGVRYVYSADAFLQWHLMFISREVILARWIQRHDRYPAYGEEVDRALFAGEPVAIVGEARDILPFLNRVGRAGRPRSDVRIVSNRYYVLYGPSAKDVQKLIQAELPN